jgi:hypothetical protein
VQEALERQKNILMHLITASNHASKRTAHAGAGKEGHLWKLLQLMIGRNGVLVLVLSVGISNASMYCCEHGIPCTSPASSPKAPTREREVVY